MSQVLNQSYFCKIAFQGSVQKQYALIQPNSQIVKLASDLFAKNALQCLQLQYFFQQVNQNLPLRIMALLHLLTLWSKCYFCLQFEKHVFDKFFLIEVIYYIDISMRNNAIIGQSDSIDLEEQIPTVPRHFYTKFFKELNNFQKFVLKQNKRKIKEEIQVEHIRDQMKKQRPQTKLIQEQVIRNGSRIKGIWKNNQLHGDVTINYEDGAFFQGKYENGVRIYGNFKFTDGHQYVGGFLCDQFNGEGILTYPNGKTIEGEWCQGQLEGKVRIHYPNGDVYYGPVNNYKKHGIGHMFFANGGKYIGEFQDGDISGEGQYLQNQIIIYEGYWQKGKFVRPSDKDQLDQTY